MGILDGKVKKREGRLATFILVALLVAAVALSLLSTTLSIMCFTTVCVVGLTWKKIMNPAG